MRDCISSCFHHFIFLPASIPHFGYLSPMLASQLSDYFPRTTVRFKRNGPKSPPRDIHQSAFYSKVYLCTTLCRAVSWLGICIPRGRKTLKREAHKELIDKGQADIGWIDKKEVIQGAYLQSAQNRRSPSKPHFSSPPLPPAEMIFSATCCHVCRCM